ncbi:MAG: 30S ribosome-binding factor RbfA [Betaproteobacteria bacterium]|jgi:ribosome-binding factor A|nr:30S ribosome-binding factor RbfA [Betaproteobacteria bacterium]
MKRLTPRAQRIGDQLQRELMDLLKNEVKDPRVGMVTITAIEVAADYGHAKVFFTHLAGAEHGAGAAAALEHAASFLRRELSHRLMLRSVPQLHFVYDDSIETGLKLSRLIDAAIEEDRQHPST